MTNILTLTWNTNTFNLWLSSVSSLVRVGSVYLSWYFTILWRTMCYMTYIRFWCSITMTSLLLSHRCEIIYIKQHTLSCPFLRPWYKYENICNVLNFFSFNFKYPLKISIDKLEQVYLNVMTRLVTKLFLKPNKYSVYSLVFAIHSNFTEFY